MLQNLLSLDFLYMFEFMDSLKNKHIYAPEATEHRKCIKDPWCFAYVNGF